MFEKIVTRIHGVKSVQIWSFFWSIFSHIRTEYGEILRISPYSFQMRENTDQKKVSIWTIFTQWLCVQIIPIGDITNGNQNCNKIKNSEQLVFTIFR